MFCESLWVDPKGGRNLHLTLPIGGLRNSPPIFVGANDAKASDMKLAMTQNGLYAGAASVTNAGEDAWIRDETLVGKRQEVVYNIEELKRVIKKYVWPSALRSMPHAEGGPHIGHICLAPLRLSFLETSH